MTIPRIIHQSWKTRDIPYNLYRRQWVESWPAFHPDWKCELWTDDDLRDFVARCYPDFLGVYDGYHADIQRADAARYFLLHHYGGLYVDLDYLCLSNLEPLFDGYDMVLTRINSDSLDTDHISNALMASNKGHVFWDFVFEELFRSRGSPYVQESTGPAMLYRAFRRFRISRVYSSSRDTLKIYASEILSPIDWRKWSWYDRNLPKRIIRRPSRYFPEAHAVTFWTHGWERGGKKKHWPSRLKLWTQQGKQYVKEWIKGFSNRKAIVASMPGLGASAVWQAMAELPTTPKLDLQPSRRGTIRKLHEFTDELAGMGYKCLFLYGDVLQSIISTWESEMNEDHFARCGYFGSEQDIFNKDFLNYERIFDEWTANTVYPTACVRLDKIHDYLPEIEKFLGFELRLPERSEMFLDLSIYDPAVLDEIRVTYSSLLDKVGRQRDFMLIEPWTSGRELEN